MTASVERPPLEAVVRPAAFDFEYVAPSNYHEAAILRGTKEEGEAFLTKMGCEVISSRPLYAIPEGWVLVPKEPTPEMLAGFWGEITHGEPEITAAKDAYRAMLDAVPPND